MSMIVRVGTSSIQWWSWQGYVFFDDDSFYGEEVVAFKEGSTATVFVSVKNDFSSPKPMNVSAVKVGFDWGTNYTSTQTSLSSPVVLQYNEIRVFTVTFQVPLTSSVSNLYLHDYKIYVEHVNSTVAPQKIVETMVKFRGLTGFPTYFFAIYSTDQADAQEMKQILSGMSMPSFNSTTAILTWTKATNETTLGGILYNQGNFTGAKTRYATALSLRNQAISTEQTTTGGLQDAQLAVLQAQANALDATASYLNGLGSMWILIGVAAVLFAIGYIIRGFATLRKPMPST
jgi:hypothetical protein